MSAVSAPAVGDPLRLPAGSRTAVGSDPRAEQVHAAVRLVALAALLGLGLTRWYGLLEPQQLTRPLLFALGATVLAAALQALARHRLVAAVVAGIAGIGVSLLVSGVPLWMLDPRDWGQLAPGLSDGISALPGVTVPYQGAGDWVRLTIASGGCLLTVLAAILAGVGRRGWAVLALCVLFAVPMIQTGPDQPWILGAALTLPLCLFLLAERLGTRTAALSAALLGAATLAGMALAPVLDGDGPVIDVQEIASALQPEQPDRFDWSHGYGPLDWPRDGRVLLRVRSDQAAYWKAEDLEFFDGSRWRAEGGVGSRIPVASGLAEHRDWRTEVRVTIGDLQTRQFVSPGETLSISRSPRQPVGTRPGGFSVALSDEDLESGNAYRAEAYVPRPGEKELRAAPARYPGYLSDELTMYAPPNGNAGRIFLRFGTFGSGQAGRALGPGVGPGDVERVLEQSGYGDVYALSQRLARDARSPYDVVARVERYLNSDDFRYEEDVPDHPLAIPAFLFEDKAGYCQHYSGAMALLLRMAGVPARVSAGFAPGQRDEQRGEYVVRDLDAHSWVEVWFDGIGWVTFDPTPGDSPARSQSTGGGAALPASGVPGGPQPTGAIGGADVGPGGEAAPLGSSGDDGGFPLGLLALALAAVAAVLAAPRAWRWWRRRRRRDRGQLAEVEELARALRRSGRAIPPETTLLELERRFAHQPEAREYVRALARRRYAQDAPGPTHAQRRALRTALGEGLGVTGRLRALWALPPRGLH